MSDDILAKIDAAVGCHACGGLLADDSPSGDFCSAECQAEWHATHVVPLRGYREPWMRPDEFPGVGTEAFRPAVQEPASVGSWYARMSDLGESAEFELVPTGRWGRVTVSNPGWPVIDWSRTPVYTTEFGSESVPVDPADAAETWSRGWSVGYSWVDEVAEFTGLMPVESARERMGLRPVEEDAGDEASVPTVQERALEARRTRNTGPAVRRRAPRRIDSPRSR